MNEDLKVTGIVAPSDYDINTRGVTSVKQLDNGDIELKYNDGTTAIQQLSSITQGTASQIDLDMATVNINAKIQELENKINQLDATLTKKKSAADITISTMRAYTRLLLAKLNVISSNKETQLRIQNLTELIEKKIMEDILK